ncbi:MAG: hypothetical protein KC416_02395 [Myxococcales bacterium]|nr:hypothetical protein [Myxococcales bacterium]
MKKNETTNSNAEQLDLEAPRGLAKSRSGDSSDREPTKKKKMARVRKRGAETEVLTADALLPKVKAIRKRIEAGELGGIPTDFSDLDDACGGIDGLFILGGKPGVGKSALAIQIGTDAAERSDALCFIHSAEMSATQVVGRILQRYEAERGATPESAERRFEKMAKRLIIIDDPHLSPDDINQRFLTPLRHQTGLKRVLCVFDSVHVLAKYQAGTSPKTKDAIDRFLTSLRRLASTGDTHVIALAHQPKTESAGFYYSESNQFDYLADVTAVLDTSGKSGRVVRIHKNRSGPLVPEIRLRFVGHALSFSEASR